MTQRGAIWVSGPEAWLVRQKGDEWRLEKLFSEVPHKHRTTGGRRGNRPYLHGSVNPSGREDEKRRNALTQFLDNIVTSADDIEQLYLLGPRPTSHALLRQFEVSGKAQKVKGQIATDRLTERQVIAKVRSSFGADAPRLAAT